MNTNTTRKYAWLMLCILAVILLMSLSFETTAFAEEASTEQIVKFEYLQRIENTPFAEKVQKIIKVPVYGNNEIKLEDVKRELKCKSFGVMQSYGDSFKYNSATNTYTAVYYKSVYLNAKTVDGNSKNFYLDCNLSFEDYFYPFVQNGTLEQSIYEFYLNKIHIRYPELDGYTPDNIYGYFGLIPIPNGRDLNQLWKDLFGTSTNYSGVLEHYMYSNVLTNSAYKKLLEEYHYNWLEVIWKGFVDKLLSGSVNADFYMVYVDSEDTEAFIAENGATSIDDNSGAIWNSVEKGLGDLGDRLSQVFGKSKKPLIIVMAVVVGVAILYLVVRLVEVLVSNKKHKGDKK